MSEVSGQTAGRDVRRYMGCYSGAVMNMAQHGTVCNWRTQGGREKKEKKRREGKKTNEIGKQTAVKRQGKDMEHAVECGDQWPGTHARAW